MVNKSFLLLGVLFFLSCQPSLKLVKLSGPVFGTDYNIQYAAKDGENYTAQFDSLFNVINTSLSTYIPDSDISRINKGERVAVDEHFKKVFEASKLIYKETNAAFDPTIGAVVNAWDFGPEGKVIQLDSVKIKELMSSVGLSEVVLEGNYVKKHAGTYLDFNAIAKGYGIDVIADFLESKGVTNYLVDIGGDLRVKGINVGSNKGWTIGIDDPNFDGAQSYSKVLVLKDEAMATSGTYRKFKVDDNGNRYAHIIDTNTGYPSKTNILSVSVIAPDCMTADGYATAFQAMGIEKVEELLKRHSELKVYFIYEEDNELKTLSLNNFPEN